MWTLANEYQITLTSLIESWTNFDVSDSGLERATKATLLPIVTSIRGLISSGSALEVNVPVYDEDAIVPDESDIGQNLGQSPSYEATASDEGVSGGD